MILTVHWVHTPASAMMRAWRGPNSRSAIRFAAYDTDNVEPLARGMGRLSFHSDVKHEVIRSSAKSHGSGKLDGNHAMTAQAPAAMTVST